MKNLSPNFLLSIFRRRKARCLAGLLNSQRASLAGIREMQNKNFLRLIEHCRNNVPYYKKMDCLNRIKSLDDIRKLPFLTKEIIRKDYDALKATNAPAKSFMFNSTSGSTGENMRFFSDARDYMKFGLTVRNNMWTGWNIGERQLFLWGSRYDISKSQMFFNRMKNWVFHKALYLSSYNMKEKDMSDYRERINRFKPKLITAYPNSLYIFSIFLEERGLSIYRPKGIICSGETLYDYQREKIESIFGCKVYNRYGSREVGNIAHQCERQGDLHINAEHIILEVIDKNGNPCKSAEYGEVVMTDLHNYAFPFIRYKIQDVGALIDGKCSCNRNLPLMKTVEGRVFDIVVGSNGNHLIGNFWTILFRTFVRGIKKFQLIQEERKRLIIKLVTDEGFNEGERQKLIARILEACGSDMEIEIEILNDIPLTESGKHRFIISKVSPFAA